VSGRGSARAVGPDHAPPVFIACNARSGSTLLRWMVDAHPEISCPGETDVAAVLESYVRSAAALHGPAPDAAALEGGRRVVDGLMEEHLAAVGKARWCDKSLSNVAHLDRLAAAWPDARFVLLHRHCMDVVLSALEASEWGLDTYGFGSYAQMSPTNPVIALVGYWVERTATMLAFEERFPDRCLRLRYEDLVTRTDASMAALWPFVGVSPAGGIARAAFAAGHPAHAPADYKIWHTGAVHHESVGRGARVPPARVGGPVRVAMNELLGRLGYRPVSDDWGSGGAGPSRGDRAEGTVVELRIVDGHDTTARLTLGSSGSLERAQDDTVAAACVVAVERGALRAIGAGTENFGVALRRRTVRRYGDVPPQFAGEQAFWRALQGSIVSLAWELVAAERPMEAADASLCGSGAAAH
jgi:hypothetical protein